MRGFLSLTHNSPHACVMAHLRWRVRYFQSDQTPPFPVQPGNCIFPPHSQNIHLFIRNQCYTSMISLSLASFSSSISSMNLCVTFSTSFSILSISSSETGFSLSFF